MSNRNPHDKDWHRRVEQSEMSDMRESRALYDFCQALIAAADGTRGGIKWRPFMNRAAIERELARLGMELCEESYDFDPRKKRFFAMPVKTSIKPEYP